MILMMAVEMTIKTEISDEFISTDNTSTASNLLSIMIVTFKHINVGD